MPSWFLACRVSTNKCDSSVASDAVKPARAAGKKDFRISFFHPADSPEISVEFAATKPDKFGLDSVGGVEKLLKPIAADHHCRGTP